MPDDRRHPVPDQRGRRSRERPAVRRRAFVANALYWFTVLMLLALAIGCVTTLVVGFLPPVPIAPLSSKD